MLQSRSDFPGYSTHPVYLGMPFPMAKTGSGEFFQALEKIREINALDLAGINPIQLQLTHAFRDVVHLRMEQANLFSYGADIETSCVSDKYITSHLYTRQELQKDAKIVADSGIKVGGTLLDSDDNPIDKVKPEIYAESLISLLVEGNSSQIIDLDFEFHCRGYAQALLRILTHVRQKAPHVKFTATCYKGEEDMGALGLLKGRFPEMRLLLMGYFYSVQEYKALIEIYLELFQPGEVSIGVSVKTTPIETALALVELAEEMKLGGMFFWNTAQDAAPPKPGEAPDPSIFPYIQLVQEAMYPDLLPRPRISVSAEAPAALCLKKGKSILKICEIARLYRKLWRC